MTPKQIYQTIKEKPYRDGEALIIDFAKSMCISFYIWENEHISKCPKLADGFAEKTVNDFFYRSIENVMPIISERDKTIQVVVELIERMQDQGYAFPDNFIKRVNGCKYKVL